MYRLTSNLNVQSVKPRGGCYLQGLYLLFLVFSHHCCNDWSVLWRTAVSTDFQASQRPLAAASNHKVDLMRKRNKKL